MLSRAWGPNFVVRRTGSFGWRNGSSGISRSALRLHQASRRNPVLLDRPQFSSLSSFGQKAYLSTDSTFIEAPLSSSEVSEQYTKQDPREHVLLRPEMYVGPTTVSSKETWLMV